MSEHIKELRSGLQTAFINGAYNSNLAYRPQLLTNDPCRGQKVLTSIEDELLRCDEYAISVAFITRSGITPLLQTFQELDRKGIPGRILTTDYLMFSEPEALKTLHSLKNVSLKMYCTEQGAGFHTKGYIFRKGEMYRIIVGSSNMTQYALTVNQEWNTRIVSAEEGEYAQNICEEFNRLWNSREAQTFEEFFELYNTKYQTVKRQRETARQEKTMSFEAYRLEPNSMQVHFIGNLSKLVEAGAKRALLISATGTGKTYASAFAVRDVLIKEPVGLANRNVSENDRKKVLFVVHREQIAKQAMQTFRKVFGSSVSFGLLSGNAKETDAQFLFSTMQMMSKAEIMEQFSPEEFSCIILDEYGIIGQVRRRPILKAS